jgi:hypothetical protein
VAVNTTILAHSDAVREGGNHPISLIDPDDDFRGDADGGHEGVCASIIACLDVPPVFQAPEHDLDFMALSIEDSVVWDVDFPV